MVRLRGGRALIISLIALSSNDGSARQSPILICLPSPMLMLYLENCIVSAALAAGSPENASFAACNRTAWSPSACSPSTMRSSASFKSLGFTVLQPFQFQKMHLS